MSRDDLLIPKPKAMTNAPPSRTVLSVAWHPRYQSLQRLLHQSYSRFTTQFPTLKNTFPAPPLVAFRRNRSLKDILTRARHGRKPEKSPHEHESSACKLEKNMSSAPSLTNEKSGVSVKTVGGNAKSSRVIYAAKCKRCQKIYVGHTTLQLNERFNLHRSDIQKHPDRSDLPKHFKENPQCDFERDLEVHVLQKDIYGSRAMLESYEDRWIIRLNTLAPNGLNTKLSEHGSIFKKLFH